MTIPSVPALPEPPSISDPTNFETEADAFLGGLPDWTDDVNLTVAGMNVAVATINTVFDGAGFVSTSTTSLAIGTGAKSLVVAAGLQLAAGMNIVVAVTASPTLNWMFGQVTDYDDVTGDLVFTVPSDGVTGSGTHAAWSISLSGPRGADASLLFTPQAATGSALALIDSGKSISGTGTFTQAFVACATLGLGWFVLFTNTGSGLITLDPNSSELIDGAATLILYPGESRMIFCDASNLTTVLVKGDLGPHVVVQDQKSSGTDGGAASSVGTWLPRTLNTTLRNIAGASLASNQLTLSAGTWRLEAWALAYGQSESRLRIRNVTDSTTAAVGGGVNNSTTDTARNEASGVVTITASKAFEVQHIKSQATTSADFGIAMGDGEVEIYCELAVTRIA